MNAFLDLLAKLLLVQSTTLLALSAARAHCWFMFNLLSTKASRPFSAEQLSSHPSPSLYLLQGVIPYQM